jgi:hypothetical protein
MLKVLITIVITITSHIEKHTYKGDADRFSHFKQAFYRTPSMQIAQSYCNQLVKILQRNIGIDQYYSTFRLAARSCFTDSCLEAT